MWRVISPLNWNDQNKFLLLQETLHSNLWSCELIEINFSKVAFQENKTGEHIAREAAAMGPQENTASAEYPLYGSAWCNHWHSLLRQNKQPWQRFLMTMPKGKRVISEILVLAKIQVAVKLSSSTWWTTPTPISSPGQSSKQAWHFRWAWTLVLLVVSFAVGARMMNVCHWKCLYLWQEEI